MKLDVYIGNNLHTIEIPAHVKEHGAEFFAKMDQDMDAGWKVGPTYIESPDATVRAQIAADKMLTAIENENENMAALMAGYITFKLPGVEAVNVNLDGEPLETEFIIK